MEALRLADAEGRQRGYSDEEMQLARFAAVAFLDESILNSRNPVFADWPRKPLQEQLFGVHVAGEIFFRNLDRLLKQNDSPKPGGCAGGLLSLPAARVRGALQHLRRRRAALDARSGRAKSCGAFADRAPEFSPAWSPGEGKARTARSDPWGPRLMIAALVCFGLMLLLFIGFQLSLSAGASNL